MSKRDEYGIQLKPLIIKSAFGELEDMLISNSNLPGPRGNLELAPSDSPKEFIPFCAIQALGAIFTCVDSEKKEKIIEILKAAANDSRWRA